MRRNKPVNQRKLHVRHQRMRSRTEHMRKANRMTLCLLVVALCLILPVTALPQLKLANEQEAEFESHWKDKVALATEALDNEHREKKAIEQDPSFLEYMARERLGWSKKGESIFVFPDTEK